MTAALATDWRLRAACAELEPDLIDLLFWPSDLAKNPAALRICSRCPVTAQCAVDDISRANSPEDIVGVRGGMTARARRDLWRRRQITRAGQDPAVLAAVRDLDPLHVEILRELAAGGRQVDAAARLGRPATFVHDQLQVIRRRLGVTTTADALAIAVRAGLITTTTTNRPEGTTTTP